MNRYLALAALAALTACSPPGLAPPIAFSAADTPGGPISRKGHHSAEIFYCHEQQSQTPGAALSRGPVFLVADSGYRFTHVAATNHLSHALVTVNAVANNQPAFVVAIGQTRGVTYRPSARYLELSASNASSGQVNVTSKVCRA
jgi:hypothetical protein